MLYFLQIEIEEILFLLYLTKYPYTSFMCLIFTPISHSSDGLRLIERSQVYENKSGNMQNGCCKWFGPFIEFSDFLLLKQLLRKNVEIGFSLLIDEKKKERVRGCENEIRLVCSKLLLTYQRFCRNGYLCYDTCYISKSHLYIHSKHNLMEFAIGWFFVFSQKELCLLGGNPFFIIELCECIFRQHICLYMTSKNIYLF